MNQEVRVALENLKGIYDEGFMTQAEYNTRRKTIIEEATSVSASAKPAGAVVQKASSTTRAAAKKSVFDRLGGGGSSGSGKWGHDGFVEMYGATAGKKVERTVYQPPAMRSAIGKADLRQKLSSSGLGTKSGRGRARDQSGGRGSNLPEKCPW